MNELPFNEWINGWKFECIDNLNGKLWTPAQSLYFQRVKADEYLSASENNRK